MMTSLFGVKREKRRAKFVKYLYSSFSCSFSFCCTSVFVTSILVLTQFITLFDKDKLSLHLLL